MGCIITYENKQYTQKEFEQYFKEHFTEFVDNFLGSKQDIEGFKDFVQGKQFQKLTAEEKAKTIEQVTKEHRSITALKDLSAKLAYRIGGTVKFENNPNADWKGYNQGMTSVLNEAYMTPDTPFHEIAFHPIIRALKYSKRIGGTINLDGTLDKSTAKIEFSKLYQNLLKELETGRGKEVFEQVKRDYKSDGFKQSPAFVKWLQDKGIVELQDPITHLWQHEYKTKGYLTEKESINEIKEAALKYKEQYYEQFLKEANPKLGYTLEEQQEEAIVTLLGLMAADKLDAKKDATLISKLKELWKQISDFVKQLLLQDEIRIDELPITTTLNDLAEIMAYGNNKIILPGYKVEYSTPLGNKYDTLEEVNQEIRGLTDDNVEVDLSGVNLKIPNYFKNEKFKIYKENNKIYKQENSYVRESSQFEGKYVAYNNDNISLFRNKGGIPKYFDTEQEALDQLKTYNREIISEEDAKKIIYKSFYDFIEKNKEFEQSKEIIEEWKKVNNIQYNPEEIYSRGQEFSSVVGAYSSFDVNLMMQNLLSHIEDNEKAGGKFAISAFTKPIDKQIGHLEGGGGKIKFKIFPKSEDILWAANTDVYSGSVWDASEKVNKNKKSELLGVSYTKYPSLSNINSVQPNLASIIDNLSHHHNELGIVLTGTNFRLEYDEDIPISTKKIINSINSILDEKFGKLVKPEIKTKKDLTFEEKRLIDLNKAKVKPSFLHDNKWEIEGFDMEYYESKEEAEEQLFFFKKNLKERISDKEYLNPTFKSNLPIEPTQTNETLKESIDSVKNSHLQRKTAYSVKEGNILRSEGWKSVGFNHELDEEYFEKPNTKEYTSQALINTKISKLKEVAKKYPRSLVTSKVVPINSNMTDNSEIQYSKVSSKQDIEGFKKFVDKSIEFSINNNAIPLSENDLTFYAQNFFKKFGVNFKILSEKDFNDNISKDASGAYFAKDNFVVLGVNKTSFNSALHEFTHPLVEWLYKTKPLSFKQFKADILKKRTEESLINELINKGYDKELYSNGKLTERGWREVLTTEIENESVNILEGLSEKSNVAIKFWKQICNYIRSFLVPDLKNMSDRQIMELSLKDIALFVLSPDTKLDLSNIHLHRYIDPNEVPPSTPDYSNNVGFETSLSMAIANYASATGSNITSNQVNVINKIGKWQKLRINDKEYISPVNGETYQRATSFLKKLDGPNGEKSYYEYFGDIDLGTKAREFGNQFDDLLQELVNGVDKSSAVQNVLEAHKIRVNKDNAEEVIVNEETLSKTYDEFKNVLDKYKNYLILPQVILADPENKIAGTLDLLLISPEGKIKIIDLKSTKYSTTSFDYMKTYGSASKKQTHTAQLSIYKGLALSNGLIFEKNDLSILPVYLPNQEDILKEAYVEPEVPVNAYSYIVDEFYNAPSKPSSLDNTYNDQQISLINNIKIILHKRLKDVNKLPDTASKQAALLQTKEILETLNQAEPIKKLTEFVNGLYYQFTNKIITKGNKKITIPGLPAQIILLNNKIANGELTQNDAIDKLLYIKTINDLYSPILDDLRFIINSNSDSELKSEMFSKLEEIQKGVSIINKTYENQSVELLADFLLQGVSKSANEEIEKTLAFQKERISKVKDAKIKEKLIKQYDLDVKKLKSEKGVTKDVLIKSLKHGSSEDIAWLDTWFTPAASSSNELISTFDRVLKDKMENARQKLVKFEREAGQAFEKTNFGDKNNPSKYNEGMYEKVNVFEKLDEQGSPIFTENMSFISEIDYNKFNQVKANHYKKLNLADNVADEKLLWRNFYKDNYVRIPQSQDITITNPITGEKIILQKSIDTLIKEKEKLVEQGIISQNDLKNFITRSNGYTSETGTTYDKEFLMINPVKFKNEKYEQLKASNKFDYYKFLVSSYFKSQERLPHKMGYILPSIKKSGWDSVADSGLINHLKYVGSELVSFKDEEVSKYGEDGKTIPMIFNFKMSADDVSLDLIQSIVMYEAESLEYEVKSKMANVGEMLLENVTKNTPYKTDDAGNKYVDSLVEKAGITDEFLKYKKKLGGNNIASLLAMHIDSQIYGKLNLKTDAKIGKIPVDKLIGGLMSFASTTQVGGNPIGSVANYLQANIQASMEAASKQFFTDKSWLKSRIIYDNNIVNFVKDFNSPYSKSLLGQLVDLYDPIQGEYKDSAGRNISKSAFKKLFNSDTWFFMQYQGEHSIQVRTMIAMLLDTKVTTSKGEVINLFDAYTQDSSGKIKLKEGVNIPTPSENGLISRDIQSKLHGLNKRMHGIYNSQDKIQIERYSAGKLLTMYKKFLLPGIKKRYKSKGIDQELGVITEGYWITFYKNMLTDVKQLSRFIIGIDNGYFSEFEKQNLRRARRELLIVAASGTFIILLKSLMEAGDDDEKNKLKHLLYLSMRINSELGIYGTFGDTQNFLLAPSPKEVYKTIKNPIPVFSVMDKLFSLLNQMTDPTAVYERDSGIWNKGDSKLWAKFLKFWGYNGVNSDPENAIKYMNMTTK